MKQPKKPTLAQKKLIAGAGLDPEKWMVRLENRMYLYIVDRGIEQRELRTIDKQTGKCVSHLERKNQRGRRKTNGTGNADSTADRKQTV